MTAPHAMNVRRLDHLVITVRDLEATRTFYTRLGMEVVTFGAGRTALHFGEQKINVHVAGNGGTIVAEQPTPGSAHLCFITTTPLASWVKHLEAAGVAIEEGPVRRTGARGPIDSLYMRDPDRNLIEISTEVADPGGIAPLREWLGTLQACVRAVDFERGRALCDPGLIAFGTVAEFVVGLDAVMAQQWRRVWPNIREFTIRSDEALGGITGDTAWVAASWTSLGTRPDGSTFPRPGRLTIIFARHDGRWLATHTHFSLTPTV
jgi:catechol 2,3-dioxygenase-like lactoylglutathione lyase family enzyme/ketosteroid isomerase-like protein